MIFKSLLFFSVALEFLFVPWYLKVVRPGRSRQSLLLKTVCSTLFVTSGLLAAHIAQNDSVFAKFILLGFALGWAGDFLLHVSQKQLCLLAGLLSFLGGHVFYIAAYSKAIRTLAPSAKFFDPAEIFAFVLLFSSALLVAVLHRLQLKRALVPVTLYAAILIVMVIKACSLGVRLVAACAQNSATACLILVVGVLLFAVSDAVLAIKVFFGGQDSHKLTALNIVTYYTAQQFLALSILFIA